MTIIEKRIKARGFCNSKGDCCECSEELSQGICEDYCFASAPEEVIDRVLEIADMEEKANAYRNS